MIIYPRCEWDGCETPPLTLDFEDSDGNVIPDFRVVINVRFGNAECAKRFTDWEKERNQIRGR